jgi:ABC-2 type transport system ATP-binding protein
MTSIITVENLVKVYEPNIRAVDDITFEVEKGEIFGFLGPNGAGKSTAIKVLTTLLRKTSGTVKVKGFDLESDAREIRRIIGYASQEVGVDTDLTGMENIYLQCRFHHVPKEKAKVKADELIKMVGLGDAAHRRAGTYSGGMKRRLDLATALVSDPEILFLDEPTTGLDPQSRRAIWDYIRQLNVNGTTIFLTTQYMEEADQLAHRLCIIDNGKIVAEGEPAKLKAQIGADLIKFRVVGDNDPDVLRRAIDVVSAIEGVKEARDCAEGGADCAEGVALFSENGSNLVPLIVRALDNANLQIENLTLSKPSLDDVFIKFTGKQLRTESVKMPSKVGFRTRRR